MDESLADTLWILLELAGTFVSPITLLFVESVLLIPVLWGSLNLLYWMFGLLISVSVPLE